MSTRYIEWIGGMALLGGAILVFLVLTGIEASKQDVPARLHFAVVSDPHVYDTTLGTTGAAFEADLRQDVKLVAESEAILVQAGEQLRSRKPEPAFLLISGDLTKDGEQASHRRMAARLHYLQQNGLPVYVIPGNHDIDNPAARRFDVSGAYRVDSLNAREFADIYADFGYRQAVARDADSLSYVVEPVPGFWLIALDSCRYGEGHDKRIDGGRLREATVNWLLARLDEARRANKHVIAMMHHGLLEHFTGQARHFGEFLAEDQDVMSRRLAEAGLRFIFTGHAHAQDAVRKRWGEGISLVDIETGSLVTFPNPYRLVTFDRVANVLSVDSGHVRDLPGDGAAGRRFVEHSREATRALASIIIDRHLSGIDSLSPERKMRYRDKLVEATLAHYVGDEHASARDFREALALSRSRNADVSMIGKLRMTLQDDAPPADNAFKVNLRVLPEERYRPLER